jgi:hypothetical protein
MMHCTCSVQIQSMQFFQHGILMMHMLGETIIALLLYKYSSTKYSKCETEMVYIV